MVKPNTINFKSLHTNAMADSIMQRQDIEATKSLSAYKSSDMCACRFFIAAGIALALCSGLAFGIVFYYDFFEQSPCKYEVTNYEMSTAVTTQPYEENGMFRIRKRAVSMDGSYLNLNRTGIPAHMIALVHGDEDWMNRLIDNTSPNNSHLKFDYTCSIKNCCGKNQCCEAYCCNPAKNEAGEMWCPSMKYFNFPLAGSSHIFRYFQKASWMTEENYKLLNDGKIRVKSTGMYMVQVSIHFFLNRGIASARLKREKNADHSLISVADCNVEFNPGDATSDDSVWPCSIFSIMELETDDLIYLDITTSKFFKVTKESLYITVIKLNSFGL